MNLTFSFVHASKSNLTCDVRSLCHSHTHTLLFCEVFELEIPRSTDKKNDVNGWPSFCSGQAICRVFLGRARG